jgi:hypothetical protein
VTEYRPHDAVVDAWTGTWPLTTPVDELLREYLSRRGWEPDPPGPGGALWRHGDDAVIAVPDRISQGSVEWRSVIERLAAFEARPPIDVVYGVQFQMIDVTHLRAANDIVIAGSIPLEAGVSLVSSGWAMLRAAATSSVRPRSHIAGNFLRSADEIVSQARLGHTQEGSYIIPLLMPLSSPEDPRPEQPPVPGMEIERSPIEPVERRVTRILAQALSAVDQLIVMPEGVPPGRELNAAVIAGASRELVTAVHRVLADPSVSQFEARFAWAGAVGNPSGVPSEVRIPVDALQRLDNAARRMKATSYSPTRSSPGLSLRCGTNPTIRTGRYLSRPCVEAGLPRFASVSSSRSSRRPTTGRATGDLCWSRGKSGVATGDR